MPYVNGIWENWTNYTNTGSISNSTNPVGSLIHSTSTGLPWLFPVFLGALYIFLWYEFNDSPSRFKLVGITGLVFTVSIFMTAAGFIGDALINFIVFVLAFVVAMLLKI